MDNFSVVGRASGGEQVPGYAQLLPAVEELLMIPGHYLLGGLVFLLGSEGDRGAVLVAAGYHQNMLALEAMIPCEDIGRQVGACDMSHVQRAVGIGPSYCDKNVFSH